MLLVSSFTWLSVVWLGVGTTGFFGLDSEQSIPSLTPYSDVDLSQTIAFTNRPGRLWVQNTAKHLIVTAYTDRPKLWSPFRYKAAMKLAKWYFRRCNIHLSMTTLHILPKGTLTKKGLVQWRLARSLRKTKNQFETFLFFTDRVDYMWGKKPKKIKLLGVSAKVWLLDKPKSWKKFFAVWVKMSLVYTTLAHELGHRLGLKHASKPYRLMLNGAGVKSSAETLFTSLAGFFAPQRFRFSVAECQTMHRTLRRETASLKIANQTHASKKPKTRKIIRLVPFKPIKVIK